MKKQAISLMLVSIIAITGGVASVSAKAYTDEKNNTSRLEMAPRPQDFTKGHRPDGTVTIGTATIGTDTPRDFDGDFCDRDFEDGTKTIGTVTPREGFGKGHRPVGTATIGTDTPGDFDADFCDRDFEDGTKTIGTGTPREGFGKGHRPVGTATIGTGTPDGKRTSDCKGTSDGKDFCKGDFDGDFSDRECKDGTKTIGTGTPREGAKKGHRAVGTSTVGTDTPETINLGQAPKIDEAKDAVADTKIAEEATVATATLETVNQEELKATNNADSTTSNTADTNMLAPILAMIVMAAGTVIASVKKTKSKFN